MSYHLKGIVKQADESGSFVAVASMPTLDRDGEVVAKGAFLPLPESIPVHAFHRFDDPIGRAVPRYDGDALIVEGRFGRSARAQEIRSMVLDGIIGHVSVGFMPPETEMREGIRTIVKSELLEVSMVSVPSNRQAAILAAKGPASFGTRGAAALAAFKAQLVLLEADLAALGGPPPVSRAEVRAAIRDTERFLDDLRRP